jgi:hypothetical protein
MKEILKRVRFPTGNGFYYSGLFSAMISGLTAQHSLTVYLLNCNCTYAVVVQPG